MNTILECFKEIGGPRQHITQKQLSSEINALLR